MNSVFLNEIQFDSMFCAWFSVATQPICLHPDRDNLIVGKRATIVGWGKMSHAQRQPVMQFLEVPLTAWDQCAKIYGSTGALESPKSVGMLWKNTKKMNLNRKP